GAVIEVNRGKPLRGESQAGQRAWDRLTSEIRAAGAQRVVVSSEFFANADDATIGRIVADIHHPQTHILVTLRPLWKITGSQWQQYVQNGLRVDLGNWLDRLLNRPPYDRPSPTFWRRHRHGELVRRWADVVGPDRVTVVAVDDADQAALLRVVERMLGLTTGTLQPQPDRSNRSLTWSEAELVRHLNRHYVRERWPDEWYANLIRRGVVHALKQHPPNPWASRITLPGSSREPLRRGASQGVQAIRDGDVPTVGDMQPLAAAPPERTTDTDGGSRIAPATAAHALLGIVAGSGQVANRDVQRVTNLRATELGAALARRAVERARVLLARSRAPIRPRRHQSQPSFTSPPKPVKQRMS